MCVCECMSTHVWGRERMRDRVLAFFYYLYILSKRQFTFGRRLDRLWHVTCVQIVIQNTSYFF